MKCFTFARRERCLDTQCYWRFVLLAGFGQSRPDSTRRQLLSDPPTARPTIGGLLFLGLSVWDQARSMRH
ncbi:hypothetical protein MPLA_1830059 [Mesorhizobium sp. ORS 3359]|nr:hypothetical protein MPLA_1830059 [Mesorhizobium sp. ORS 3359]